VVLEEAERRCVLSIKTRSRPSAIAIDPKRKERNSLTYGRDVLTDEVIVSKVLSEEYAKD
jgi:hypothetical protein